MLGFSPTALAALAAAGIMHFVWGRYCNYRATRAIGTNLVAPIQQFNLLITLALAIWLLGEHLTPLKILGIALILLGPTFTHAEEERRAAERPVSDEKITPIDAEKPAAFQPKYAEGYTFALLSATGYGLSPILIRIGLENQGLGVEPRRRARRLYRGDGGVRAGAAVARAMAARAGRSTAKPRSGSRSPASWCSSRRCSSTWRCRSRR